MRDESYKKLKNEYSSFTKERETLEEKLTDALAIVSVDSLKLNNRKKELKSQLYALNTEIQQTQNQQNAQMKDIKAHHDSELNNLDTLISRAQVTRDNNSNEFIDKSRMEEHKADLEAKLAFEIEEMLRELYDREREKVIETHELNQNITKKIEETKMALQDLKKEQLDTTRR